MSISLRDDDEEKLTRKKYLSEWLTGDMSYGSLIKENLLVFFGTLIGVVYILSFFGFKVFEDPYEPTLLAYVAGALGGIYVGLLYLFYGFTKEKLDKEISLSNLYTIHNVFRVIYTILIFSLAIIFVIDFFQLTRSIYLKLYLGLSLMILPVLALLSPTLSKKGKIELEFVLLNQNFKDFPEQQKWLTRIFKRVESALRIGYIHISYSTLSYHFNIAQRKPEEIAGDLESVKNALINEQYGTELISNLRTLCPKIEFTSFQRKPLIPHIQELFKNYQKFFAFLVLFLIFMLEPKTTLEYLEELFNFLS